jgi:hypothetical protein
MVGPKIDPREIRKTLNEIERRAFEETVYAQVAEELDRNDVRPGLWAKALAKSVGDVQVAKAIYIELRAQAILDEQVAAVAQTELRQYDPEEVVQLIDRLITASISVDTRETLLGIKEEIRSGEAWDRDLIFVRELAKRLLGI